MGNNHVIAAASKLSDTEAPTAPGKPTQGAKCQTTLTISWGASTDNVGVTGYNIYDDGVLHVDAGDVLTYNLTGLSQGSTSTWTVRAYDAEDNLSAASPGLAVTQGTNVDSFTCTTIGNATHNGACTDPDTTTRYVTGGSSTPSNGNVIYTNSCGTSVFNGGGLRFSNNGGLSFTVSSSGVVGDVDICTA